MPLNDRIGLVQRLTVFGLCADQVLVCGLQGCNRRLNCRFLCFSRIVGEWSIRSFFDNLKIPENSKQFGGLLMRKRACFDQAILRDPDL